MEADSWPKVANGVEEAEPSQEASSTYTFEDNAGQPFAVTGCNRLDFEPQVKAAVDVPDASTPTGLTVDVHVPQDAGLNPEGVAESDVEEITVTLPEGVTLNPGGADGLQACSLSEIGYLPEQSTPPDDLHFTPSFPSCPDQSKIATVTIHSPLLPNPLQGAVYLATPAPFGELNANPFNSLIAMYLVAEDPVSGTLVKLPGVVSLDPVTGRLTSTFDSPQLPFEDAELHFFGGGRAPLSTPPLAAPTRRKRSFTPWSGNEPVHSTSTFQITSGPNGSPCPSNPRPFAPDSGGGRRISSAGAFSAAARRRCTPTTDQPLGA